jgi:NADPH-dependent 2,4-dienoyl-CoA reductase/sulfur reductase-like enzyme
MSRSRRSCERWPIAPDERPLARVTGPEIGNHIRRLHESKGVVFHLGETVSAIDDGRVKLKSGGTVDVDIIVVDNRGDAGDGFHRAQRHCPRSWRGRQRVSGDERFGIYGAGALDMHTGERIRVEHGVVAERQGQVTARNMLGRRERFDAVPFFWSAHYDTTINYVGHATGLGRGRYRRRPRRR